MKKLELVPEATVSVGESLTPAPAVLSIADVPDTGRLTLRRLDGTKVEARMAAGLAHYRAENLVGRDVLVVFENNDVDLPIAIELIHSPGGFSDALTMDHDKDTPVEARVDGKRVTITAEEKLELRCGKASITIDAKGKITIRGAHIYNRATGPIRIKGGHVDIN
jgi:hypothetical protein